MPMNNAHLFPAEVSSAVYAAANSQTQRGVVRGWDRFSSLTGRTQRALMNRIQTGLPKGWTVLVDYDGHLAFRDPKTAIKSWET